MITKINLNAVASYKSPVSLTTDKKVNLIYGLNGTGKSTLSNYLFKQKTEGFENCSIEGLDDSHVILVYNQKFIQENFFESENLKGIFTLSQQNKEAETKILNANNEIVRIEEELEAKKTELELEKKSLSEKYEKAKNVVWEIKTDYSGGDRVLEYCLEGYKRSKEDLFNYINGLLKPALKPIKSIEDIKNELQSITGDNAQKYLELPLISFPSQKIEIAAIFIKQIVGNENSSFSQLINELKNSDWVKSGLVYLPTMPIYENQVCPFCQENTISNTLIENIKNYFDATYEADINTLKNYLQNYKSSLLSIPNKSFYEANPKFEIFKKDFEIKYNTFLQIIENNKQLIEDKIKNPSIAISLSNSTKSLIELNDIIKNINTKIDEHNKKIDQKENVRNNIKKSFWDIMRWDYDQTIHIFKADEIASKTKTNSLTKSINNCKENINIQKIIIIEEQKKTINIDDAIISINNGLVDLGINDFEIMKHSDNLYKIIRGEKDNHIFHSLSEGEKMIISFLYFIELCRGKKEATETDKKKIIVIDDPISSLSHIYIFNIGRLIKKEFFGKKNTRRDKITGENIVEWIYNYEQVIILTHSLYFFYEITEIHHDDRKVTQNLIRLSKNQNGSTFVPMHYEEIQNDYQAYWSVIKEKDNRPALIANCMRNIIEYFFNFVEKKDLNNCFNLPPLNTNRFQSFYRYINRESHSLGQNIFDFKEFNYDDFIDAFKALFNQMGYEDHYNKMMGIKRR